MKTLSIGVAAVFLATAGSLAGADAAETVRPAQAPATAQPADVTHIAVVIDTSYSMRDSRTERILDAVVHAVNSTISLFPNARFFQVIDADGRPLTKPGWVQNNSVNRGTILAVLPAYSADNISNPIPGLAKALEPTGDPAARVYVVVIGDELASDAVASIPAAIARLNPPGPDGKKRARISAIQVPTGTMFSPDTNYVDFESVMRRVTTENGGVFVQLDPAALARTPAVLSTASAGSTGNTGPVTYSTILPLVVPLSPSQTAASRNGASVWVPGESFPAKGSVTSAPVPSSQAPSSNPSPAIQLPDAQPAGSKISR